MRKKLLGIVFAGALLLGAAVPAFAGPPARVDICHVPPGNPENARVITVSERAVDAHEAHGDDVDLADDTTDPCGVL